MWFDDRIWSLPLNPSFIFQSFFYLAFSYLFSARRNGKSCVEMVYCFQFCFENKIEAKNSNEMHTKSNRMFPTIDNFCSSNFMSAYILNKYTFSSLFKRQYVFSSFATHKTTFNHFQFLLFLFLMDSPISKWKCIVWHLCANVIKNEKRAKKQTLSTQEPHFHNLVSVAFWIVFDQITRHGIKKNKE